MPLLTIEEFSEEIDLSRRQVYEDLKAGMPCLKLPVYIPREEALLWRSENRRKRRKFTTNFVTGQ